MINVLKASGEYESYNEGKVRSSLKRAGADDELIEGIIKSLQPRLYDGIPTSKIYSYVFELLRKSKSHLASKYNLKRAIMKFGPTGYPFEQFIAGILQAYGYKVAVNKTVKGQCIDHEIDVIAEKNNRRFMIECKFHNHPGVKTDSKVALYVYARLLDLKGSNFQQAWLVTNTKLTINARKYANCAGLKIIAWDYPADFSLRFLIEKSNLHPITCLNSLSSSDKEKLLEANLVFCHDLIDKKINLLSEEKLKKAKSEVLGIYHQKDLR